MINKLLIPLLAGTAFTLTACGGTPESEAEETAMVEPAAEVDTIVDVASANPDFSTLVSAVQAADLVDTLSGTGPYTVFAPTDAAFAALPDGTLEELTSTDTDKLGSILTYHVVPGEIMSADLATAIEGAGADGYKIDTVNGAQLTATLVDGNVVLTDGAGNTATVTATDVNASNGVIHAIDTVLMPA